MAQLQSWLIGDQRMNDPRPDRSGYLLAALVGGLVGGLAVTVITKLIPKIKMISGMMAEGG